MKTAVAYLRKSTKDKQAHSFDRQLHSIQSWADRTGVELVGIYREAVSGKLGLEQRPELVKAFATGETVVVSSVDRLSRNVAVGSALLADRKIVVAELGLDVDSLILNVLLCVSEAETRRLSRRVKQGLQRAKARGVQLGNPKLNEARKKSNETNRAKGDQTVATYAPMINRARQAGARSSREIASFLNEFGVKAPRGGSISHKFVLRCLAKMEA
tara:strand:- start:56 stop:700 length:645 start_codon:yes stop_codon:yes gene_type:complete